MSAIDFIITVLITTQLTSWVKGDFDSSAPLPLNETWKVPENGGKTTCGDRLLNFAMTSVKQGTYSTYGEWFGCCSSSNITTLKDTTNHCCLTFGSTCNDLAGEVRCCREQSCCGGRCLLTSGTPTSESLNGKFDSTTPNKNNNTFFVFNGTASYQANCENKEYPLFRLYNPYKTLIRACCKNDYKGTKADAATKCCVTRRQACDSSVPCCNNRPCISAKCPGSSGSEDDENLGGKNSTCRELKPSSENTMVLKKNGTCRDTVFNILAKTNNGEGMGCCRSEPKDAKSSAENCCLLKKSTCNGGIGCCRGLLCCNGFCGDDSGKKNSKSLSVPFYSC